MKVAALFVFLLAVAGPLSAMAGFVNVVSPDHGQTFSYGSERNREWLARGSDRHLAVALHFTNDPFVDNIQPRQYDDFIFNFPGVRLAADGRTFMARDSGGHDIPVAIRRSGFLGLDDIRLLPSTDLIIEKRHGFLTVVLAADGRLVDLD